MTTLLHITRRLNEASAGATDAEVMDALELPFDLRQKSRLRVTLRSGADAALFMERGTILRGGDMLQAEDGRVVRVEAAAQPVLHVTAASPRELARAAYHLGNRHVPLQVGEGWLRLEQDHVLEDMLLGLGVTVSKQTAPFEPEAGAYGGSHRHYHDDDQPAIRMPRRQRHG